jgi:hypothetical protein
MFPKRRHFIFTRRGNYPKEDNIRFSQNGESLKTRMETTHVSETSTLYIHTPGNYPKEYNI